MTDHQTPHAEIQRTAADHEFKAPLLCARSGGCPGLWIEATSAVGTAAWFTCAYTAYLRTASDRRGQHGE